MSRNGRRQGFMVAWVCIGSVSSLGCLGVPRAHREIQGWRLSLECVQPPLPLRKNRPLAAQLKKKRRKKGPLSFVNIGDYRIKKHADNNTRTKTGKPAKVYKNYYYNRRAYVATFSILYCLDFSNCSRRAKSLANKFHDFLKFNFSDI